MPPPPLTALAEEALTCAGGAGTDAPPPLAVDAADGGGGGGGGNDATEIEEALIEAGLGAGGAATGPVGVPTCPVNPPRGEEAAMEEEGRPVGAADVIVARLLGDDSPVFRVDLARAAALAAAVAAAAAAEAPAGVSAGPGVGGGTALRST